MTEDKRLLILGTNGSSKGTTDYNELENKPKINGTELEGDVTIDFGTMKKSVVESLPTENIDENTIYLVPNTEQETGNVYDEYMYINNTWEHIGSTKTDLSDYYTKEEVDEKIDGSSKVITLDLTDVPGEERLDSINGYTKEDFIKFVEEGKKIIVRDYYIDPFDVDGEYKYIYDAIISELDIDLPLLGLTYVINNGFYTLSGTICMYETGGGIEVHHLNDETRPQTNVCKANTPIEFSRNIPGLPSGCLTIYLGEETFEFGGVNINKGDVVKVGYDENYSYVCEIINNIYNKATKSWYGTEEEYDKLEEKDPDTDYFIEGEAVTKEYVDSIVPSTTQELVFELEDGTTKTINVYIK